METEWSYPSWCESEVTLPTWSTVNVCMHLTDKMWGNGEVIQLLHSTMNTACLQMQCTNWAPPNSTSPSSPLHHNGVWSDISAQFLSCISNFACCTLPSTSAFSQLQSHLHFVVFLNETYSVMMCFHRLLPYVDWIFRFLSILFRKFNNLFETEPLNWTRVS